jgi:hypothetical protein
MLAYVLTAPCERKPGQKGNIDSHVLEITNPYFRPSAYAELLRAKVSELPRQRFVLRQKGPNSYYSVVAI